jgi:hypothetical protein
MLFTVVGLDRYRLGLLVERRLGRFVPILMINMDFSALGPEYISFLPSRYTLSIFNIVPIPGMNPPMLRARLWASFFARPTSLVGRFLRLGRRFAMAIPQHILWMCMIPQEVALDYKSCTLKELKIV